MFQLLQPLLHNLPCLTMHYNIVESLLTTELDVGSSTVAAGGGSAYIMLGIYCLKTTIRNMIEISKPVERNIEQNDLEHRL